MAGSTKVGPYYIKNSILKFGENAIKKAADSGALIIIDEYGPLEWRGDGFHKITQKCLKSGRCIILVRKILLEFFKKRFKSHMFKVFELTEQNRDSLHIKIYESIKK